MRQHFPHEWTSKVSDLKCFLYNPLHLREFGPQFVLPPFWSVLCLLPALCWRKQSTPLSSSSFFFYFSQPRKHNFALSQAKLSPKTRGVKRKTQYNNSKMVLRGAKMFHLWHKLKSAVWYMSKLGQIKIQTVYISLTTWWQHTHSELVVVYIRCGRIQS